MTMTIELSPETEAKICRNAEREGLPLQDYVRQLLENVPTPPEKSLWETLSPEEFAKALREWSESHTDWPTLSDEAISRENIYGDNH